jgi:hypothetical protein
MAKLTANKKFILSNKEGVIEYRTTEFSKGYYRGIYFSVDGIVYSVSPRTFSSIISNLERYSTKKNGVEMEKDTVPCVSNGDTVSVFYSLK